ncbi:MAG: hypothetical protein E6H64_04795 [Betaproteobacteria bacterium]|nr:MAG: hypothetical protein E6H64_04795 [Betaproteobacteria bacterium]
MTSKDAAAASSRLQTLHDEAQMILDEARMVLPGIQALFGFQLIAVFTEDFRRLADVERLAHLGSLLLVTIAIALIMTPAAYDRIVGEPRVSRRFITLASRLITSAIRRAALCRALVRAALVTPDGVGGVMLRLGRARSPCAAQCRRLATIAGLSAARERRSPRCDPSATG